MAKISDRVRKRLRRLAWLRATGHTWTTIAEETGWPSADCETLTQKHAALWRRLMLACLRLRALETLAEGMAVLRLALRQDNWTIRRGAAASLVAYQRVLQNPRRRKLARASQLDPESMALGLYLQGLAEEEREQLLEQLVEQQRTPDASA